ncbi:MAG: SemiSWEET family sugar transporter [Nanobdellota archaeon]
MKTAYKNQRMQIFKTKILLETNMAIISILATIFGTAMALANIPQAIKIFHRKSAKDISILTFSVVLIGSIVWTIYGINISNTPLIVANSVGVVSVGMVVIGGILYR